VSVLLVVCYDVNTEDRVGRRRLRRVARACESFGQRVQKSVFECRVNLSQLEELERRLLCEIDFDKDSLRLYRLSGKNVYEVKEYGHFRAQDFDDPLVL